MNKEREAQPNRLTLEGVTHMAKETALAQGGHVPVFLAEGGGQAFAGKIDSLADTHEGRMEQLFGAGLMVAKTGVVTPLAQVFFISEGWLSMAEGEEPPQLPPSQDPKRIEVLLIAQFDLERNADAGVMFEMLRDDECVLRELKPLPVMEEEGLTVKSPLLEAFVLGYAAGFLQTDTDATNP